MNVGVVKRNNISKKMWVHINFGFFTSTLKVTRNETVSSPKPRKKEIGIIAINPKSFKPPKSNCAPIIESIQRRQAIEIVATMILFLVVSCTNITTNPFSLRHVFAYFVASFYNKSKEKDKDILKTKNVLSNPPAMRVGKQADSKTI